jgi:hypothetical protein
MKNKKGTCIKSKKKKNKTIKILTSKGRNNKEEVMEITSVASMRIWIHRRVLQGINCTVNGLEIIVNVGSHLNSRKKNKIKSTLKKSSSHNIMIARLSSK